MLVAPSLCLLYLYDLDDRYVSCSVLTNDVHAEFVGLYISTFFLKNASDNNKYTPNTTNIDYIILSVCNETLT
jgi:hypothetical protein